MTQTAKEREQVDLVRTWGPRLARAIALLALIVGVLLIKSYHGIKENTDRLTNGQKQGCHRANVERANNNKGSYDDYHFFVNTVKLFKVAAGPPPAGTSKAKIEFFKRYLKETEGFASDKAWVPLTNCVAISPRIYEPPVPIPFSKGQPPSGAFTVGPGQ